MRSFTTTLILNPECIMATALLAKPVVTASQSTPELSLSQPEADHFGEIREAIKKVKDPNLTAEWVETHKAKVVRKNSGFCIEGDLSSLAAALVSIAARLLCVTCIGGLCWWVVTLVFFRDWSQFTWNIATGAGVLTFIGIFLEEEVLRARKPLWIGFKRTVWSHEQFSQHYRTYAYGGMPKDVYEKAIRLRQSFPALRLTIEYPIASKRRGIHIVLGDPLLKATLPDGSEEYLAFWE